MWRPVCLVRIGRPQFKERKSGLVVLRLARGWVKTVDPVSFSASPFPGTPPNCVTPLGEVELGLPWCKASAPHSHLFSQALLTQPLGLPAKSLLETASGPCSR